MGVLSSLTHLPTFYNSYLQMYLSLVLLLTDNEKIIFDDDIILLFHYITLHFFALVFSIVYLKLLLRVPFLVESLTHTSFVIIH